MARESIAMSHEESRGFLAAQRWIALGTLEPDGAPWASLAPALLEGEKLCFAVPEASREARNLERDPRACCVADQFPSYYEIRGVSVHGRAAPVRDAALRVRLEARLAAEPLPGWGPDAALSLWSLPLDDVFSFDFGKIRNRV